VRRVVVGALLLAACAAAPRRAPPAATPAETADLEQLYIELRNRDNDFRFLNLDQSSRADCGRIGQLKVNICALAERICRIAEREPPGSAAAAYCEDGKTRCQRAAERARRQHCDPETRQPVR
jgi:hypothetical protein